MATKTQTAFEIRKELDNRRASLNKRLAAIRQEFAPLAEITNGSLPTDRGEPLTTAQKVGFAAGTTLVLGVLLGIRSRKKKLDRTAGKGTGVRLYVDHVLDEAAKLVAKGKDPESALEKVLRRKQAIVQVEQSDHVTKSSILSELPAYMMRILLYQAIEAGLAWIVAQGVANGSKEATDEQIA